MIKNIAIVSLSSGTIGEGFVKHEVEIGIRRLKELGLNVRFMPHAMKGIEYVKNHPEERAADLLQALRDPEIDMILCAIGGDDTYRMLPYLFEGDKLAAAVSDKIFLGFSDTTVNHFMLHKVGMNTFYGQSFLADICELDKDMLPYTKKYFEELIRKGTIREIRPSGTWYEGRADFGAGQIGIPLRAHPDHGFELLQGKPVFSGKILGGCIDTIYDFFNGDRYADMPVLCRKYGLFPKTEDWAGRILLLESSEEKMSPEKYRKAITALKETGIFKVLSGVLVGKPMDEIHDQEYKQILREVIDEPELPIVCNLNIGHAQPRCIIPFGIEARVDAEHQVIRFTNVEYRPLREEEIQRELFGHFIRHQTVDLCLRWEGDRWIEKPDPFTDDWGEEEYQILVRCLRHTAAAGGLVYGAFVSGELKGFVSVEAGTFGGDNRYMDLSSLHVSEDMRRHGIGKCLFEAARDWAREQGAGKLYISSHSAIESQRFYEAMGCVDAVWRDPRHVEAEPYDRQLEYVL